MRTVAIEEHAACPEVFEARIMPHPESEQVILNDLGEGRLASMDESGIDVQVISLQPGLEGCDPKLTLPAIQRFNDVLGEAVAKYPTRFAGLTALPLHDAKLAATELQRGINELGMVGAQIGSSPDTGFLENEANWPIFEAAEGLGVPIYMHPSLPPKAVYDAYYADLGDAMGLAFSSAAWGWHVDTGLHAMRMILKGVFDQFPKLQVIVGHMGEAIPFMLGRAEERMNNIQSSIPDVSAPYKRQLRDYFRDNIHISTSGFFNNEPLRCAIDVLGADRIMFAVDYPFSHNSDGRAYLDQLTIDDNDKQLITHANADKLFALKS